MDKLAFLSGYFQKKDPTYYRYTDSKNRGIMSDTYWMEDMPNLMPPEKRKKMKWLPMPPGYPEGSRSYFTEKGDKKFSKANLKDFVDHIKSIKQKELKDFNPDHLYYKDKYQIILNPKLPKLIADEEKQDREFEEFMKEHG